MFSRKTKVPEFINLQMFADGGAAGGGADAGAAAAPGATGVDAGVPGQQTEAPQVLYGKQDGGNTQAADAQPVEKTRTEQFRDLIKGEWADEYGKAVQETVQKRLRSNQEAADRGNAVVPILEMLSQKYGVDNSDVDGLIKAIQDDDSYYEQEALESGMSVQQLKEVKKIQRENEKLKAEAQDRENRLRMDRDIQRWQEQTNEARKIFPGLDLSTELQNEQFKALLRSGVDVGAAYQVVHRDEIMPQMMQFAAQQTEQQVVNKITSKGNRPAENGLRSNATAIVKSDPSKLTAEDIADIRRRVAMGEVIRF